MLFARVERRTRRLRRRVLPTKTKTALDEAAAYYARARPGLGEAFLSEVRHAVDAFGCFTTRGNGGGERDSLVAREAVSVQCLVPGA
jgi:hypothetical protein